MKKLFLCASFLLLTILPMQLRAEVAPVSPSSKAPMSAEVQVLMNRIEEIKKIDLSTLNSAEKKELRNEVKTIKADMKAANGGVYLSVGALILVLILLILLL